jgi:two-component system chemotaxis response regulator CheY
MVADYGDIDQAVDGVEAVAAVERAYMARAPYDLIFLDIMLPRKDGQAALREIRDFELKRGIPAPDVCKVVMTTALSDAKNVMGAFGAPCEGYITKPFSKPQIDAQIRKIYPDAAG